MPQKVVDILAERQNPPLFSFEYFPPKTEKGVLALYKRAWRMQKQKPLFSDITWGAGGSTSELTMDLSTNFIKLFGMEVNMHLTCTNIKKEAVEQALDDAKKNGIKNILALRGDPPAGQDKWEATEGGFECALDLVNFIKEKHGDFFGVSVAGYPEGHPNAIKKVEDEAKLTESEKGRLINVKGELFVCHDADFKTEMEYLKKKIDAGGQFIVTQLFYDAEVFFTFEKACRDIGITVPIFPGIMPIANKNGFWRMTGLCKTRLPDELRIKLEGLTEDAAFKAEGHKVVLELCKKLWASGKIPALHFYTLNTEKAVYEIMRNLGITVIDAEKVYPEEKEEIYAKIAEMVKVSEPAEKKAKTV